MARSRARRPSLGRDLGPPRHLHRTRGRRFAHHPDRMNPSTRPGRPLSVASRRCTINVSVPATTNMATLTPSTANAPAALPASPTPAATPRYAAAGIVVIDMATPTAELAP